MDGSAVTMIDYRAGWLGLNNFNRVLPRRASRTCTLLVTRAISCSRWLVFPRSSLAARFHAPYRPRSWLAYSACCLRP